MAFRTTYRESPTLYLILIPIRHESKHAVNLNRPNKHTYRQMKYPAVSPGEPLSRSPEIDTYLL